ncbi:MULTISPECIES: dUTP diphosphatase [Clostridium]|uniref:dUTP diphosphatase n=1 Tax=Clostridium TaxID=1485 RepID=UPI000824E1B5|nr:MULTISPECIES: dUTP diphosphatase [Clostridium]PJI08565.1 hypothetical protein CUB90_12160 [Clostridium sp. CT7]
MDLNKLFHLQKNLDAKILEQNNLTNQNLSSQKILALQVKFGELANGTQCFSYWETKSPCKESTILDEYLSCLHFILSIGIDNDFTNFDLSSSYLSCNIIEQFLGLFIDINDFVICSSRDNYTTLFQDFINLGECLGFDDSEIEANFLEKNVLI